jgi:hypothetical protein
MQASQVGIDDRREIERHQLRKQQAADNHEPEGLSRFAACPIADRDRDSSQHGRHGGHHNRPEADQAALVNCLHGRQSLLPFRLQRKIDLHDGILLDDSDQHDQSDKGINIQIEMEQEQGNQRAEAGGRQPRKDCYWLPALQIDCHQGIVRIDDISLFHIQIPGPSIERRSDYGISQQHFCVSVPFHRF